MAFCTQCGHRNPDEGRFCEECGTVLGGAVVPSVIPQSASATAASLGRAQNSKKLFIGVGGGVAALLAIVVGLYVAFAPESASNGTFTRVVEHSLTANPERWSSRFCLVNFDYGKDVVHINTYDGQTQQWLNLLVKNGLYSGPETVTSGNGFFVTQQFEYRKTDAGKKATPAGKLCIADGLTVAGVDGFTPPQKVGDVELSQVTVKLALRNPVPWVKTDEAKSMLPNSLTSEMTETIAVILKNGKWDIPTPETARSVARSLHSARAQEGAGSGGMFDKLLSLFTFPGSNPILGKWSSNMMGMQTSFDFRPDSMRSDSGTVNVRYKVEDGQVIVYPNGGTESLIVKVIDKNTLSMMMGFVAIELKRVE